MSQYRIVFSPSHRRPGCVLLQGLGGTVPSPKFYDLFPPETWLVTPTDDMAAYPADDAMLEQLSRMAAKEVSNG